MSESAQFVNFVIVKNKLMSVFNAYLFFTIHGYFDSVMTKFMINN